MKQTKFKDLARNKMAQEKMGWVNPALSKERAVVKFPSVRKFLFTIYYSLFTIYCSPFTKKLTIFTEFAKKYHIYGIC